jgi:hypothetical protein
MSNRVPRVPPCPNRVPGHGAYDRVPRVPALTEGGTRDTVCRGSLSAHIQRHRVPGRKAVR